MSAAWDTLINGFFDRHRAEALRDKALSTGSPNDIEQCFSAFIPLAGNIFKRKGVHRQDWDDALSSIAPAIWRHIANPNIDNISAYLNVVLHRSTLSFMRTHPLYSKKLNQTLDLSRITRRQLSMEDALHLDEISDRIPEMVVSEACKKIRHAGKYRDIVFDAISCYSKNAVPSPKLVSEKFKTPLRDAFNLCQVALVYVRIAQKELSKELGLVHLVA
jgi:hypothetical protein